MTISVPGYFSMPFPAWTNCIFSFYRRLILLFAGIKIFPDCKKVVGHQPHNLVNTGSIGIEDIFILRG
jgi:hypothetical protein